MHTLPRKPKKTTPCFCFARCCASGAEDKAAEMYSLQKTRGSLHLNIGADLTVLEPGARIRDRMDMDSMDLLNFVIGLH